MYVFKGIKEGLTKEVWGILHILTISTILLLNSYITELHSHLLCFVTYFYLFSLRHWVWVFKECLREWGWYNLVYFTQCFPIYTFIWAANPIPSVCGKHCILLVSTGYSHFSESRLSWAGFLFQELCNLIRLLFKKIFIYFWIYYLDSEYIRKSLALNKNIYFWLITFDAHLKYLIICFGWLTSKHHRPSLGYPLSPPPMTEPTTIWLHYLNHKPFFKQIWLWKLTFVVLQSRCWVSPAPWWQRSQLPG